MPGTKWGQRWGDPWGRSELRVTSLRVRRSAYEPGVAILSWDAALHAKGTWYKIFRDTVQVAITRRTIFPARVLPGEDHVFEVIDVGPLSGDAAYDIAWACWAVAGNKVLIEWDQAAGATEYPIYWDEGDGSIDFGTPYAVLKDTGAAQQSWLTPALTNGTYKFCVRARDAAGNETTNTTALSVTITAAPHAITNLEASYDKATETTTLAWIDPPGIAPSGEIRVYYVQTVLTGEWDTDIGSWPPFDYSTADLTTAGIGDETIDVSMDGSGPRILVVAIRAYDDITGLEDQNTDVRVRVENNVDEEDVSARPARAERVTVVPAAGGKLQIDALIPNRAGFAAPAGVKVWYDTVKANVLAGTGTEALMTMTAGPDGWRASYLTPALVDATLYYVLVRAGAGTAGAAPYGPFRGDDVWSATTDATAPAVPGNQAAAASRGGAG